MPVVAQWQWHSDSGIVAQWLELCTLVFESCGSVYSAV